MEQNNKLGLYPHNLESYRKIREAFLHGEDTVGIVHATGTGKSYNALQLAYDNKDKKILYVTPSLAIIEHVKKIINDNPELDMERDFSNLVFRTYESFIDMSYDELSQIDVDLLILDEFHHLGAPVWGSRIKTIVDTHPGMMKFGMTAYTIRDRGTSYERDMANPDTDELFSNKIVSTYDLCDAMIDGVLPKPIYKSAYYNLIGVEKKLEDKVLSMDASSKERERYLRILEDVKKRVMEAPSIDTLIKRSIKPDGKYIYFCPPISEVGTNDIETIKAEAMEWFKKAFPDTSIVFYETTSEMGEEGRLNREAFYNDVTLDGEDAKRMLRVMFAINQYNEGVHAPNVDGVIMGRGTTSDIVYFEQLGRALSVIEKFDLLYDKYSEYSREQLIEICQLKDIIVTDDMSRWELIEKLAAPVIVDLTNNFSYIKELETKLGNRIKEYEASGYYTNGNTRRKIIDASFYIELIDEDLFEMLMYIKDNLYRSWEDYYELATIYYDKFGNSDIPRNFRTFDGINYDAGGADLDRWFRKQRQFYLELSPERRKLLEAIKFNPTHKLKRRWLKMYELATAYAKEYKNLDVPVDFKTKDGITYDDDGETLGPWVKTQKKRYDNMSEEEKRALAKIGFTVSKYDADWRRMYEKAKEYFLNNGHLLVPFRYKTSDGARLGAWVKYQREYYNRLSDEKKKLLAEIGFVVSELDYQWERIYAVAYDYYLEHGDFNVPKNYITDDGIKLGYWNSTQRKFYDTMSDERKKKLAKIDFIPNVYMEKWNKMFKLAEAYSEKNKNLDVPADFITKDGVSYDAYGDNLYTWIKTQKKHYDRLSDEQRLKLESIGVVWDSRKNKRSIIDVCNRYTISYDKNIELLEHMPIREFLAKIGYLSDRELPLVDYEGKLNPIFSMSNMNMLVNYGVGLEELISAYCQGISKERHG